MPSDDIEREALAFERSSATFADMSRRALASGQLETSSLDAAVSAGLAFRAAELRYDARGGMTAALERRRFEPGARWSAHWKRSEVATVTGTFESYGSLIVRTDTFFPKAAAAMTRANGWLFLGLSDLGGYR